MDTSIQARRFNPCFVGCYSESFGSEDEDSDMPIVSILVLLDVILKAGLTGNSLEWMGKFQSLFCWMLF